MMRQGERGKPCKGPNVDTDARRLHQELACADTDILRCTLLMSCTLSQRSQLLHHTEVV